MAKAERRLIAIFPSEIPIAMIIEFNSIVDTGALTPEVNARA